ncbi:MAG: hypothetical protein IH851_12090 [Armatimonadetes bacterium]|nr:hypothetical protein [Armatimonadota bacterium]
MALAYLWRTEDVRLLGNYVFIPEGDSMPSLTGGFAFQSAFENRIAPFVTAAKRFHVRGPTDDDAMAYEVYVGLSRRGNEEHVHGLTGLKISPPAPVYFGFQHTGHDVNYYFGIALDFGSVSFWIADGKKPGIVVSFWR